MQTVFSALVTEKLKQKFHNIFKHFRGTYLFFANISENNIFVGIELEIKESEHVLTI